MGRDKKKKQNKQEKESDDFLKNMSAAYDPIRTKLKEKMSADLNDAIHKELEKGAEFSDFIGYCTDTTINAADPYGDGDQSDVLAILPTDPGQMLRNVWCSGCDLVPLFNFGRLSEFARNCFLGCSEEIKAAIKRTDEGSIQRMQLLEERVSNCRLSPLMVCICGARNCAGQPPALRVSHGDYLAAADALCAAGARVNATDLAGYSVCYHCTTSTGNATTFAMCRMIVSKYGGDVNLYNRFGSLPILEAAMNFRPELLEVLLECGANVGLASKGSHPDLPITRKVACTAISLMRAWPEGLAIVSKSSLPHWGKILKKGDECALKYLNRRTDLNGQRGILGDQNFMTGRWQIQLENETVLVSRHNLVPLSCCVVCGQAALKRCALCQRPWYCGKDCQRVHWKSVHKAECQGQKMRNGQGSNEANQKTASVKNGATCADAPEGLQVKNVSLSKERSANQKTKSSRPQIRTEDGKLIFPIKIQTPAGVEDTRASLMVYNQDRSFSAFINPPESAQDPNIMYDEIRQFCLSRDDTRFRAYILCQYDEVSRMAYFNLSTENLLFDQKW